MHKISTCLWFDGKAEEAARFYTSVFRNAKLGEIMYYGDNMPFPKGSVMTAEFEIENMKFIALNGPPMFKPSPAISLFVTCDSQAELDGYWDRLGDGGEIMQCGWLTDKFGVTWQIVPKVLGEMIRDKDKKKVAAAMQAMMKMKKLDIAELQRAYDKAA